jgi:hypothetical protein
MLVDIGRLDRLKIIIIFKTKIIKGQNTHNWYNWREYVALDKSGAYS